VLKEGFQLEANERHFRVNTFQVDDVPELADFVRAEGTGVEAMFAGILVAFLTARLSFESAMCLHEWSVLHFGKRMLGGTCWHEKVAL